MILLSYIFFLLLETYFAIKEEKIAKHNIVNIIKNSK
jgi:hypothetical protein